VTTESEAREGSGTPPGAERRLSRLGARVRAARVEAVVAAAVGAGLVGIALGVAVVSLLGGTQTKPVAPEMGAALLVRGIPQPFGGAWQVVGGGWHVAAEQGLFTSPASGPQLAVLASTPVAAAQVRLAAVGDGAGLVFGYRGPQDFWTVTAAPSYGTWAVVKVAGGRPVGEGNLGLASTARNSILAVVVRGDTADVGLDGKVLHVVTDPSLDGTTRAGVTVAPSGVDQTRFEDFQVVPTAVPAPPVKPPAAP